MLPTSRVHQRCMYGCVCLFIHMLHNSGIFYLRSLKSCCFNNFISVFLECSPESLSLLFQQSETCTSRFYLLLLLHKQPIFVYIFTLHFRNWFLYDVYCIVLNAIAYIFFYRRVLEAKCRWQQQKMIHSSTQ